MPRKRLLATTFLTALALLALRVSTVHAAPPLNDDPSGAVDITAFPFVVDFDPIEATVGPEDPNTTTCRFDQPNVGTLWFRIRSPFGTMRRIAIQAGNVNNDVTTRLSVLTEPGGAALVDCATPATFVIEPGQIAWVVLGVDMSIASPPIDGWIRGWAAAEPPVNDEPGGAIAATWPDFRTSVDMGAATHGSLDRRSAAATNSSPPQRVRCGTWCAILKTSPASYGSRRGEASRTDRGSSADRAVECSAAVRAGKVFPVRSSLPSLG